MTSILLGRISRIIWSLYLKLILGEGVWLTVSILVQLKLLDEVGNWASFFATQVLPQPAQPTLPLWTWLWSVRTQLCWSVSPKLFPQSWKPRIDHNFLASSTIHAFHLLNQDFQAIFIKTYQCTLTLLVSRHTYVAMCILKKSTHTLSKQIGMDQRKSGPFSELCTTFPCFYTLYHLLYKHHVKQYV